MHKAYSHSNKLKTEHRGLSPRKKLYRPSDRRLSAKLVSTFVDRGCHEVRVTDPYGRILGFLDRLTFKYYQKAVCVHLSGKNRIMRQKHITALSKLKIKIKIKMKEKNINPCLPGTPRCYRLINGSGWENLCDTEGPRIYLILKCATTQPLGPPRRIFEMFPNVESAFFFLYLLLFLQSTQDT
jgi:hypothetical protein